MLQLRERCELARINERRRWDVLRDVRSTAIDGYAAGVKALEELLGNISREARVFEYQRETIARQHAEFVLDDAAIDALRRCMQHRVHSRVALPPALAVQVELIGVGKRFD